MVNKLFESAKQAFWFLSKISNVENGSVCSHHVAKVLGCQHDCKVINQRPTCQCHEGSVFKVYLNIGTVTYCFYNKQFECMNQILEFFFGNLTAIEILIKFAIIIFV